MQIRIDGVHGLAAGIGAFRPDAIISIGAADEWADAAPALAAYDGPLLRLEFVDIDCLELGLVAPGIDHLSQAAAFIGENCAQESRLLVHCHAGISRSPAVALYCMAQHMSGQREGQVTEDDAKALVNRMFEAAPTARPNRRIIGMTDHLLPEYGHSFTGLVTDLDPSRGGKTKASRLRQRFRTVR